MWEFLLLYISSIMDTNEFPQLVNNGSLDTVFDLIEDFIVSGAYRGATIALKRRNGSITSPSFERQLAVDVVQQLCFSFWNAKDPHDSSAYPERSNLTTQLLTKDEMACRADRLESLFKRNEWTKTPWRDCPRDDSPLLRKRMRLR